MKNFVIVAMVVALAAMLYTVIHRPASQPIPEMGIAAESSEHPGIDSADEQRRETPVVRASRMPTADEKAIDKADRIRRLEERMVTEPVSPQWAAKTEENIRAFLAPANLRAQGVPEASMSDSECRSDMCRIDMQFDEGLPVDQTMQALLQHISAELPSAEIFQTDSADGSHLMIFASSGGGNPPTNKFQQKGG